MRGRTGVRGRDGESGNGVFVSKVNCPRCLGEMLWSGRRSRWECECGKTNAVIVVARCSAEPLDQQPQAAHETDPVSVSGSLHEVRRWADSGALASVACTRQWIH